MRFQRTLRILAAVLSWLAFLSCLGGCGGGSDPSAPAGAGLPAGWLGGRVVDDQGRPLGGVRVVAVGDTLAARTAADGTFAIGPFAAGDTATLMTESPDTVSAAGADDAWYDFITGPLAVDDADPVAIALLTRCDIELAGPWGTLASNDHFSHFLEYSTNPLGSPTGPSISWGWESLPLAVYVPDTLILHATADGEVVIDAGACMREACARWNTAFAVPVLRETQDAAAAQVICSYPVLVRTKVAETAPVDSARCGFRTCPPSRVEVRMSSEFIPDAAYFTNIAVHEFGHALGFWGHISPSHILMEDGEPVDSVMLPGGGISGYPIHRLEMRAIVARFHIPQGTALEQYEGTFPLYADFPAAGTDPRAGDLPR